MKLSYKRLLALLSVLVLLTTSTLAVAEEDSAHLSGNVELGGNYLDLKDNPARVNEYVKSRPEDGLSFAPKLDLEYVNKGFLMDIMSDVNGSHNQDHAVELDFNRVLRIDMDYQEFEHVKDHDNLEHLGATMSGDIDGDQPRIFTNATKDPDQYSWELDQNYIVQRREWSTETDITLPALPNVTFHAGSRIETRKGLEQAITLSKCSACHVEANPKDIDEKTEDLTFGATGKFGILTVDYEYLTRDFEVSNGAPSYEYWNSGKWRYGSQDPAQMLYINEELEYNKTPESEKDSHSLKARLDLSRNSVLTGSYVKADIDSAKESEPGIYEFVGSDTLTSKLEAFALKGATRIGGLRLSMHGSSYEIDGPEYSLYFPDRVDNVDWDHDGVMDVSNNTFAQEQHYESAESREVVELGFDAVYRLARGTTLRFGYDYEDIERDEEELGETETHTYKLSVNSRIAKGLNTRASYTYQDISDPFGAEDAVGIAQGHPDAIVDGDLAYLLLNNYKNPDPLNPVNPDPLAEGNTTGIYYWNTIYPARGLDATNQPEEVHEAKVSTTWSPAANLSMTAYLRTRYEENNSVKYEETSYVPGLNLWYAPNGKMNLVMAYNFNKQETENQMCVGWYHG